MIRIIVRIDDAGMAANVGGSVLTEHKTFDYELPEVEDFIKKNKGSYTQAQIEGWEIIESKIVKD